MGEFRIVGLVESSDGDIAEIYSCELEGWEAKNCFFKDGEYGVTAYTGFSDVELVPINKFEQAKGGLKETDAYRFGKSIVTEKLKGDYVGVIFVQGGYILITERDYCSGILETNSDGKQREYGEGILVGEVEYEELEEYGEELCKLMDI